MGRKKPFNILFVVWDACRYDYALEYAPFLNELAASNIRFENAIAPSPWSLPSHASMFTGEYPHEHGRNRFGDSINTPLLRRLSDQGYTTYGVSANGFASQRTGFDADFDEFRYTGGRDLYVEGMDISGTAQGILRDESGTYTKAMLEVLRRMPKQRHRLKSLANLLAVGCGELATKFERLQAIRHPVFAPTSDYSYNPKRNTHRIRSILKDHDREESFFLFTNYMDTHRCYNPPDELQKKHLGRVLEYDELVRLNEEVAAPWEFERRKALDELDDKDVETLRGLYAGEVETADRHLRKLYEILENQEILEDTLIIVTADHGENLGETDEMGRRRMGHEASVSDAVLRVPLTVANPKLEANVVEDEISLDSLHDVFISVSEAAQPSDAISEMLSDLAVSQYPATGGTEEKLKKYPEVPEDTVRYSASEDTVVTYTDGWKVIADSTGEQWVSKDGAVTHLSEAPEEAVSTTKAYLEALSAEDNDALTESQVSRLENLGYI